MDVSLLKEQSSKEGFATEPFAAALLAIATHKISRFILFPGISTLPLEGQRQCPRLWCVSSVLIVGANGTVKH